MYIEFKRCGGNSCADIFESYCAFLNRGGGELFLGVADDGTVHGVPSQTVDSIVRKLIKGMNDRNQLAPPFYVLLELIDYKGLKNIRLRVPRSSDVYCFKGVCYDRVLKVSGTEQLALMYLRKQNINTEQKMYPYITLAELKPELLQFARGWLPQGIPNILWLGLPYEELLKSAGLCDKEMSGVCAADSCFSGVTM